MYAILHEVLESVSFLGQQKRINANAPVDLGIQSAEILQSFMEEPSNSVLYILDENLSEFSYYDFSKFLSSCEKKTSIALLIHPSQVENVKRGDINGSLHNVKVPVIVIDAQCGSATLRSELLKAIFFIIIEKFQSIIDINTAYAKMSLKNEGLHSMISYFKEIVRNPIAIYDENFNCLEATDSYLESFISVKGSSKSFYLNNLYFLKQKILLKVDGANREYSFVHFPISFENKIKAYLAVLESNKPLTELDYSAIEIAATAILMEMKHRLAIRSVEEKNTNSFIYDLLYQNEQRNEDILKEAEALGLIQDSHYAVIVLELITGTDEKAEQEDRTVLSETLKDKMLSYISKYFRNINQHNLVGTLGKSIIVLYRLEKVEPDSCTRIKNQCEKLSGELKAHYEDCILLGGIGDVVEGIHAAASSYKNARMALSYGRVIYQGKDDFIVQYEDASILKLISAIRSPTELESIIPSSLKAIREYDRSNRTELYVTLSAYLNSNCNAKIASEKMFIHYKTMLYRLDKISEMFHIDLNNSDERLDLTLGVKILSVLSAQ